MVPKVSVLWVATIALLFN